MRICHRGSGRLFAQRIEGRLVSGLGQPTAKAQDRLDLLREQRGRPLRILDAGCGHRSALDYGDAIVTGVDVSAEALGLHERLDEKILADLETVELPASGYDAVVSWYVLEHLPDPRRVLEKLVFTLAPGGLLILAVPNVISAKGLLTKFTPLRFHVWWYRHVKGSKRAGMPGFGPFKTYLRFALAPGHLVRLLGMLGLTIEEVALFRPGSISEMRRPVVRALWRSTSFVIRLLSFGRLGSEQTEVVVLARREYEKLLA